MQFRLALITGDIPVYLPNKLKDEEIPLLATTDNFL
jgi:hypothetical protein